MASKKNANSYGNHETKSCGAPYELLFTEAETPLPYLKCTGCGHEIDSWIKWYEKYSKLWENAEAWSNPADHVSCILGYFCHLYKQNYEIDYTLSYQPSGLFRGPEAVFCRRILAFFAGDALAVKEYLDWFFQNQIKDRKKKIVSMSVLTAQATVGKFKLVKAEQKKIHRSTKLPSEMLGWIAGNAPSVLDKAQLDDYGDLQTLLKFYASQPQIDEDMRKFVQKLYKMKMITNQLEIIGYTQ